MTKPVVLVVEDEPLVRLFAADMLEDAGFEVRHIDLDQRRWFLEHVRLLLLRQIDACPPLLLGEAPGL